MLSFGKISENEKEVTEAALKTYAITNGVPNKYLSSDKICNE